MFADLLIRVRAQQNTDWLVPYSLFSPTAFDNNVSTFGVYLKFFTPFVQYGVSENMM